MTSKIDVRQIYFAEWQMALLEPEFTPFSNAGCPLPDEREFYVFRTEYAREPVPDDVLRGYVSWKFRSKSDISGRSFVDFIRENPGHDVYFVQPFPLDLAKGNVWSQGELYHPGIIDMTQEIFDAIGYDIDLRRIPTSLRINAACNFWVGNRRFWDGYMAFCLPIYKYIEEAMPPEQRRKLLRPADRTIPASYFSFIFERLFTTLLAAQPSIKALAYTYGGDELAAKYEPNAAALAAALQRTEALHPSVPEPFREDPLLVAALNLYVQNQHRASVSEALELFARAVWRSLPARIVRLRNRGDARRNLQLKQNLK